MGKIRNDVMLGLFRSASSFEALQSMILKLQEKDAKAHASHGEQPQEQKQPEPEPKKEIELKIPEVELPKIGRNDTVVISKNGEVKQMKFKKAQQLIENEGWTLEKW